MHSWLAGWEWALVTFFALVSAAGVALIARRRPKPESRLVVTPEMLARCRARVSEAPVKPALVKERTMQPPKPKTSPAPKKRTPTAKGGAAGRTGSVSPSPGAEGELHAYNLAAAGVGIGVMWAAMEGHEHAETIEEARDVADGFDFHDADCEDDSDGFCDDFDGDCF